MFSYYGSKSKLVYLYPKPVHDIIIEPFAGSARYSLLHFEHEVHLYDLSKYVLEVWNYLLNASKKDILSLPEPPSKVNINEYDLTDAEKYLIGFHLSRGQSKPRKTGHGQNGWVKDKQRIAKNLYKIKHWKVFNKSYDQIENIPATWFIDPPYQQTQERPGNSDRYEHGNLNYTKLADWVMSRQGQVIACEGGTADYLPFRLLKKTMANTNGKSVKRVPELIYDQYTNT